MKQVKIPIFMLILISVVGCYTLTPGGKKVNVARIQDLRPPCRAMQQEKIYDALNLIRNRAAEIGATHVVIGEHSGFTYDVTMVNCPNVVTMNDADVKNKCEAKDSDACVEMAYRSVNDSDVLRYLNKSCLLKNDIACHLFRQVNDNIQDQRRTDKAMRGCNGGNSRDCLVVTSIFTKKGRYSEAIQTAERACALGNKSGCSVQANLINQQQHREQLLMQAIILQHQNAAAAQAQQQQIINTTAIQNQMLLNTVLQQKAPQQKYYTAPH